MEEFLRGWLTWLMWNIKILQNVTGAKGYYSYIWPIWVQTNYLQVTADYSSKDSLRAATEGLNPEGCMWSKKYTDRYRLVPTQACQIQSTSLAGFKCSSSHWTFEPSIKFYFLNPQRDRTDAGNKSYNSKVTQLSNSAPRSLELFGCILDGFRYTYERPLNLLASSGLDHTAVTEWKLG